MSGSETRLERVLGVPGAVVTGLGSILGTGIFVSVGIAAGVAGPAVVVAVALAAVVATLNGLSSAQLAAAHPVSGGTYEYGHRYLVPRLGFLAGWTFLCAKSASAATAALGLAGYVLAPLGVTGRTPRVALALAGIGLLTAVVAGGMRRSHGANVAIVSVTLAALLAFVGAGLAADGAAAPGPAELLPGPGGWPGLLHATALVFVAYTGYGRIATLGEEVREPARNVPRAIVITLAATALLYVAVTWVAVRTLGAEGLAAATGEAAAPLEAAARRLDAPALRWLVALGAVTAMAGVLLNLLLGLSRVLLAMGRRGDVPRALARVTPRRSSPRSAVLVTGVLVAGLAAVGRVETTWSFSAFTVLVYYALTNLAALRLPRAERRYPPLIPALGLAACLGLAFWVEAAVWAAGLALLALGLVWHAAARRLARRAAPAAR